MTNNDTNKLIRKYIIDNCKIIKIIDVDSGVFKHTNIKTKVLILKKEKTSDYNYEIDYLNINKKYEVKLVQKFKLNEDYHLSIKTNYEDLIISNKDIEIKTLGEVCDIDKNVLKHSTEYGKPIGKYKFHTGGIKTDLYVDKYDIEDMYIIQNRTNGSGKCNLFLDKNFSLAKQTIVYKSNNNNDTTTKYIYYYLLNNINILEYGFIGVNHKNISHEYLENIKIPIPSLEVQEKIIKQIEDIDILIKLRKDINENLKKEKEYLNKMINNKIITSNINEFGEIFDLIKGTIQSSKVEEDEYGEGVFINWSIYGKYKKIKKYNLTENNKK